MKILDFLLNLIYRIGGDKHPQALAVCRQLQQILADKVRVTENLGLRHNDWGGVCRKIGSRHTCPNKLLKG